jgi:hypothetical protein
MSAFREAEAYPGESSLQRMESIRRDIRTSATIPDELKEPIIERFYNDSGILEHQIQRGGPNIRFQIGQLGWSHWAIKNDNLKLVEILAGAALAIAGFASVTGASPVVLAVSLLAGSVAVADRLKRKGVQLTEEQYRVLMSLKVIGPATAADLAARMSGLHLFGQGVWSEERMETALQALKSTRLLDGTTDDLVTQGVDKLWSTNGL